MQTNLLGFNNEVYERTRSSEKGVKIKLPTINFIGNLDKSVLLKEIEYFENIYFSLVEKMKIKDLEMGLLKQDEPTPKKGEILPVTLGNSKNVVTSHFKEPKDSTQATSNSENLTSEIDEEYTDYLQIYLREVGHSVAGTYLGHSSKYANKAQKQCFGIFLSKAGSTIFLQSTQLRDVVAQENPVAGDYICITKLEQFSSAADRFYIKAAKFSLKIIEQTHDYH